MSERMIELQRAKLGLPPAGVNPSMNSSNSTMIGNNYSANNVSSAEQPTPVEVATASLLSEDAQIQRFIDRLDRRDKKIAGTYHHQDSMPSNNGPTVPTALSRRMLHRQGVGYLDDAVASVVSASADRFLATVLQQSIACRDQRLKGAAMAREAAKQRKRHMQHYEEDIGDRKRRKDDIAKARETIAIHTIAAAEALKKKSATNGTTTTAENKNRNNKKKKGTKSEPVASIANNPVKLDPAIANLAMEEDEEEYDSIDEEEEYYKNNVADVARERVNLMNGNKEEDDDDEDDDDDDTLLLRDIVRPLEAWNFHLNGKEAIVTDDIDGNEHNDLEYNNSNNNKTGIQISQQSEEKANDDSMNVANGTDRSKQNGIQDDVGNNGFKNVPSSTNNNSSLSS